jgi:hypothetical protein
VHGNGVAGTAVADVHRRDRFGPGVFQRRDVFLDASELRLVADDYERRDRSGER